MTAEEKNRFFDEVGRNLRRGGFETETVDGDGLLPVRWQSQPLCRVTAEGGVIATQNSPRQMLAF